MLELTVRTAILTDPLGAATIMAGEAVVADITTALDALAGGAISPCEGVQDCALQGIWMTDCRTNDEN